MSVSRHHADWLSLVESSGPFLSLPVLLRAFPQGLDPRDPEQAKELRLAYEEWQENPTSTAKQRAWVMHVLTQVLLHPEELLTEGQTLPPGLMATMAEYGEVLRPELALLGPIGSEVAGKPQLLISLYPVGQSSDKPAAGKHWKATPGTRMMELLHATDVPLGLVTNGEEWMLVFAPRGDTTGFTSWYASLWIDEPITLRAFHSLLSTRRFFGVAPSDTLFALLKESAQDQQEVTNQLGDQVRDAVEVLIQAFDRLDQDSGRTLLKGLDERSLYDAALTVMMRLVFLFSAEERGLLHLNEPLYDNNYAVSTLREQLQEVADRYGEEVLERRHDGWARLLATFRAVHGGVNHQDLMLPAYGGSLFDPDRYPFIEGRAQESRWQSSPAAPLEINNRVVLHLLKSLQMLQVKVPGGGPAEALRVSFEGLNIEQIGHVYEGLLDHTAVRAKEVVLGLAASRKKPVASIALAELEKLRQDDEAKLIEVLEEETGRSAKALENALKNGVEPEDFHKVLIACGQDKELAERIIPFRGLLRQDSFERLVVVLPGGIYVGRGSARRSTGTHYTPRSLTEPIVQRTLEPLVYQGPAEGLPKEQWRLRSPKEILDLKVCDMAMGSGAFLVQACRYLSERLVEAWENLEKEHPREILTTPEGGFSLGEPSERLIPKEAAERLAIARRLVADRCLYGVDINPMAVEMAKLSIWLITVDKSRPFTFLDHALKCGDSLLGIRRLKQLETFSLDDERAKQLIIVSNYDELIRTAIARRRELEILPSNDATQIEAKKSLLADADERLERLKLATDLLIVAELAEGKELNKGIARAAAHLKVVEFIQRPLAEFRRFVNEQIGGRVIFHWPLEFPEVFEVGGFDSFIGNPPFMKGHYISRLLGYDYRAYLEQSAVGGQAGLADLVAFFFRRAIQMVRTPGHIGLVATNSIADGDTNRVGLGGLQQNRAVITRAVRDMPWPGSAGVVVTTVHVFTGRWAGTFYLEEMEVTGISPTLNEGSEAEVYILAKNAGRAFIGSYPLGDGFVVTPEKAAAWIADNPRNADVLRRYMTGKELFTFPDQLPRRWIINFWDWPEERAKQFPDIYEHVAATVKSVREKVNRDRRRQMWWLYAETQSGLYKAIGHGSMYGGSKGNLHQPLPTVLVKAKTSSTWAFVVVPAEVVFDQTIAVFAFNGPAEFSILQSLLHQAWAEERGSTLKTDMSYTPSSVFVTFPFPDDLEHLTAIGRTYQEFRRELMISRQEGLTKIYNRFEDAAETSEGIVRLRALQVQLDQCVAESFGWSDLDLGHCFRQTKQGTCYTIGETARHTLLGRLLALNQQRHDEEIGAGLHEKKANLGGGKRASRRSRVKDTAVQGGLY